MSNTVLCDCTCQTMWFSIGAQEETFHPPFPRKNLQANIQVTPHNTRMLTLYRDVKNVNYVFSAESGIICLGKLFETQCNTDTTMVRNLEGKKHLAGQSY